MLMTAHILLPMKGVAVHSPLKIVSGKVLTGLLVFRPVAKPLTQIL